MQFFTNDEKMYISRQDKCEYATNFGFLQSNVSNFVQAFLHLLGFFRSGKQTIVQYLFFVANAVTNKYLL